MRRTLSWTVAAGVGIALAAVVGAVAIGNVDVGEEGIKKALSPMYAVSDPRFAREIGTLLGPPLVSGNQYRLLRNGDEIFPAMLAAIRDATKSIDFESYVYWSGAIGQEFADALSERARAGVRVNIVLDWVGSEKMQERLIKEMTASGAHVYKYHPPRRFDVFHFNNRTHRKILVVDGKVGFTGGVGIAPEWTGHAQDAQHWRDSHFEVRGPVVAQMQTAFVDNWIKVSGEVLRGDEYFPVLASVGDSVAQVFSSSPTEGSENMELMYLLAISAATRSIDLSAAYFVPDAQTSAALVSALRRGVRIRIIVPGDHMNSETTRAASRARWGPPLANGALIAEYQPTMFHCKVLVVDGLLVSVGSPNFDNRSFHLNDETSLNILDAAFALQQTQVFEEDLAKSKAVSFREWTERSIFERLAEHAASLVGSQV
jgi:cardiolipin synthase